MSQGTGKPEPPSSLFPSLRSQAARGETPNDPLLPLAHYQSRGGRKQPGFACLQSRLRRYNLSPTAGPRYTPGPKAPRSYSAALWIACRFFSSAYSPLPCWEQACCVNRIGYRRAHRCLNYAVTNEPSSRPFETLVRSAVPQSFVRVSSIWARSWTGLVAA